MSEGRTTQRSRDRVAAEAFNPMLLGFGLFLAWCTCAPGIASGMVGYRGPSAVKFCAEAVFFIALALFANVKRRDLHSPRLLVASTAIAVIAPLVDVAAHGIDAQSPLAPLAYVAASLVGAWGIASLYLLWHEQYARRPQRCAWTAYAASFVLDPLVYFVVSALPAPVSGVVVCALLIASCAMLSRCAAEDVFGFGEPAEPRGSWKFPWRPALLMMAFSFAYYMLMHLLGGASAIGRFGNLTVAVVMLLVCAMAFDRFDARALYLLCPTLMVAALLAFAQDLWPLGDPASFVAYAGFTGFTLFCDFALNSVSFRYGVQAAWLFGIVLGCNSLAHMAGSFAGTALIGMAATDAAAYDVAIYGVVIVIVALSMLLAWGDKTSANWGVLPSAVAQEPEFTGSVADAEDAAPATGGTVTAGDATARGEGRPAHADSWQASQPVLSAGNPYAQTGAVLDDFGLRCSRVARHYGLTHREEQVLALMAQGYGAAQIEAELYISHNTCKGHMRHVYGKLGVHARDEAAAIVRDWR